MILEYDDEDYWSELIPNNYWLTNTKCKAMLATVIHRCNPDVHDTPAVLPPGATRNEVRAGTQLRNAETRQAERMASLDDQDVQFKKAKLAATQGVVIRQQNDAISSQLSMLQSNHDAYAAHLSEEAYQRRVVDLLQLLPNPIRLEDDE